MYLQIHIIDFDDENNIINKNVLLHQVGEIWHISTSPADKGVLATCYNKSKSFLTVLNLFKCFDIFKCSKIEHLAMCKHFKSKLSTQAFSKKCAVPLPIHHLSHILRSSWLEVYFCIHIKESSKIKVLLAWLMQSMANKIYSWYFRCHSFYCFICLLLKVAVNVFQNSIMPASIKLYFKIASEVCI